MTVQEQLLEKISKMEKELEQMRKLIEQIGERTGEQTKTDQLNVKKNTCIWDSAVEGIPEKLDGRKIIIECLMYMQSHGEVDSREIQIAVAKNNGKKLDAINMNLRYAIKIAWKNQVPATAPFNKKPSVSEFLKYWYNKKN